LLNLAQIVQKKQIKVLTAIICLAACAMCDDWWYQSGFQFRGISLQHQGLQLCGLVV